MALVNLGGRMPDGTMARELLVEESEFVCASGTALAGSLFKQILGKLCLTRTALVMLPYESHGYRARESILHMAAEQEKWLDTYVKGEPLPDGLERAPASSSER